MHISRRLAVLGATLASAMSLASTVGQAPASAAWPDRQDGLQPLNKVLQPVDPRDPQWVSIRWATDRRVCHVRVRVRGGRDVDVAYPSDRRFTSFSRGEGLRPGRVDYTSFRVTVHRDGPDWAFLTATVDYDYCRWDSPTINDAIGLWLPVRAESSATQPLRRPEEAAATRLSAPPSRG
jgi:hypothetical protein